MDVLGTNPNHKGLRVFAISFQNKPCVLEPLVREHRPSLALSLPLTKIGHVLRTIQTSSSILSTDTTCQRFYDSILAPSGWSTPRNDDEHRGQTARNQILYTKIQYKFNS